MDLEAKLGDAVEEISQPVKMRSGKDKTTWIPRPPAKLVVACHPGLTHPSLPSLSPSPVDTSSLPSCSSVWACRGTHVGPVREWGGGICRCSVGLFCGAALRLMTLLNRPHPPAHPLSVSLV